jgi:hypothetical protein
MPKRVYFAFHYQDVMRLSRKRGLQAQFPGGRRGRRVLRSLDFGKAKKPMASGLYYSDLDSFPVNQQPPENLGKNLQLSHWLRVYDCVSGDGFKEFQLVDFKGKRMRGDFPAEDARSILGARRYLGVYSVRFLLLVLFGLVLQTVGGPWNNMQTSRGDYLAILDAMSVGSLFNALECLPDFVEERRMAMRFREHAFLLLGKNTLIPGIYTHDLKSFAPAGHCSLKVIE